MKSCKRWIPQRNIQPDFVSFTTDIHHQNRSQLDFLDCKIIQSNKNIKKMDPTKQTKVSFSFKSHFCWVKSSNLLMVKSSIWSHQTDVETTNLNIKAPYQERTILIFGGSSSNLFAKTTPTKWLFGPNAVNPCWPIITPNSWDYWKTSWNSKSI